jgi:hypothetical protein
LSFEKGNQNELLLPFWRFFFLGHLLNKSRRLASFHRNGFVMPIFDRKNMLGDILGAFSQKHLVTLL